MCGISFGDGKLGRGEKFASLGSPVFSKRYTSQISRCMRNLGDNQADKIVGNYMNAGHASSIVMFVLDTTRKVDGETDVESDATRDSE